MYNKLGMMDLSKKKIRHKHHIVPKHSGGTDDPSNLIEVSITQHAMWHYANWSLHKRPEDFLAWKGLSGQYSKQQIIREVQLLGASRGGKIAGNKAKEAGQIRSLGKKYGPLNKGSEHCKNNGRIQGRKNAKNGQLDRIRDLEKCKEVGRRNVESGHLRNISSLGGKIGGKIVGRKNAESGHLAQLNLQKWMCTITGKVSTAGALSLFQRKRGIDTSNRIKL